MKDFLINNKSRIAYAIVAAIALQVVASSLFPSIQEQNKAERARLTSLYSSAHNESVSLEEQIKALTTKKQATDAKAERISSCIDKLIADTNSVFICTDIDSSTGAIIQTANASQSLNATGGTTPEAWQ